MRRRDAIVAIAGSTARARADDVVIGRWTSIPHGVDPSHPEAMELGASRAGRAIARLPAAAPRVAWEREALGDRDRRGSRARAPIVSSAGRIHLGTPQGIATFTLEGAEGWRVDLGPVDASPALAPGGELVAITRSGRVVRIGPDGGIRRQVELGAGVIAPPLVLDDGSIVVACTDRSLRRHDAGLRERWSVALAAAVQRGPTRDGERIAIVAGPELVDVGLEGAILERAPLGGRGVTAAARGDDGTLWIATADGQLVALDAARRERARIAVGPPQLDDESPAIAPDGSVRIASRTALRALAPSGEERWSVQAGASIDFPARVDPDGATLVIDRAPKLVAFEPDGSERWRVPLSAHVMSAPVVTAEGAIVCVGVQGRLIVLR